MTRHPTIDYPTSLPQVTDNSFSTSGGLYFSPVCNVSSTLKILLKSLPIPVHSEMRSNTKLIQPQCETCSLLGCLGLAVLQLNIIYFRVLNEFYF